MGALPLPASGWKVRRGTGCLRPLNVGNAAVGVITPGDWDDRPVTSLWADATRQIPAGWLGFIYIAYPESSRPSVADSRTRFILDSVSRWFHRWTVIIPMSVIGRLYPRALGVGMPDLIESCLPITADGEEDYLRILPAQVFTLER